ncbi:two-component system, NtrC family, response regulator [Methylomagnum ishizawai]|uniref:Two-component system, NtrC family, response regulator n=1 Tax=Methylomagnum ishizawai TaxID=1760988 RepID=A0A1Y6D209_9GAMM|nr:PEP-CTERM-box response regulator transcription factor [Methylomagnum ishizawai]SMF96641.1 two-component system, NtrC family, response regulator [Methylomagnum ishizawai]
MTDQTLLIVEDDPGLQSQLRWSFDQYKVWTADDRESALAAVKRHQPEVVTLDLGLPPDPGGVSEGFATLNDILSMAPQTKVIVITGNDDQFNPVKCIGFGAYDFFQKPIDPTLLAFVVSRAFRLHALEEENRRLQRMHITNPLEGIVAASPEMHEVCRTVERLAPTDITVLLLGESGTGKEVLARALHALGPRAKKPFIAVNAAAIPENLLESELFGFERGAYTGATQQTKGKFELADGGTFFLDEIGDIPLSLQPKLLRVLQERVVERVGGRQPFKVDVRVVCATHQNLAKLIETGRFREDLYFRINEMIINIPPVRERTGDVAVLARAFLEKFAKQMRRAQLLGFTDEGLAALEAYHWPGNVRELEHKIKRAVVMAQGPLIDAKDLELLPTSAKRRLLTLREAREMAERQAIGMALSEAGENVTKAAELLEVARPTLYALLTKFNLKV